MSASSTNKKNNMRNKSGKRLQSSKTKKDNNLKYRNILQNIIFIGVLIAIFYPPYVRGLFFEREQLWAEIIVFILFSLYWILKKLKDDREFLSTPLDYAALGFVVVYLISMIGAASSKLALTEWLKYCMFFAVFLMVSDMVTSHGKRMTVLWVIAASGTGVALLGIDGAAGSNVAGVLNDFFRSLGLDYDVFFGLYDGRVHSTIQYANALAGYMMTVFFVIMAIVTGAKKVWQKILAGSLAFIIVEVLILTISRGAYLVFAIGILFFLIVLPKGTRVKSMALLIPPVIVAGLVYIKLQAYIAQEIVSRIWMLTLAGLVSTAILMLLAYFMAGFLEKLNWKVYVALVSLIVVVGSAGAIYVFSAYQPLVLESAGSLTRSVSLKPGDYTLNLDIDAVNDVDRPYAANIRLSSRNQHDILFGGGAVLLNESLKSTQGMSKEDFSFVVPENSQAVEIVIRNSYDDTSLTVTKATIADANNSKTIKDISLVYKYIPENIVTRFQSMFDSRNAMTRAIYYKDGLTVFSSNWLNGAGGGAWSLLYFSQQSFLYWSKLVHNFWLQLAVEAGVLGLLALLFLSISLIVIYFVKRPDADEDGSNGHVVRACLFTSIAVLLGHSLIDFDLSLTSIYLVLWVIIGVYNSYYRHDTSWRQKLNDYSGRLKNMLKKFNIRKIGTSPVLMIVLSIAILLLPVMYKRAGINAEKASVIYNEGDKVEGTKLMLAAVKLDPISPAYKIDYANMVLHKEPDQQELMDAFSKLNKATEQSWNDAELLTKTAVYYTNFAQFDAALEAINRTTQLRPLWEGTWQQKAAINYNIAMYLIGRGETAMAMPYVKNTINVIDEATTANLNNMDPFIFEANTMSAIEKMQFVDKEKNVNPEDIVFYNIPSMDVDADTIPDQWTIAGSGDLNLKKGEAVMKVNNSSEGQYLQSRSLILEPDTQYRVSIEADYREDNALMAKVTGMADSITPAYMDGMYVFEFATPNELAQNHYLQLFIQGELDIAKLVIGEIR